MYTKLTCNAGAAVGTYFVDDIFIACGAVAYAMEIAGASIPVSCDVDLLPDFEVKAGAEFETLHIGCAGN